MTAHEPTAPHRGRGRPLGSKTTPKPRPAWMAEMLAGPDAPSLDAAPSPVLTLSETAALVGLSHWTFRKVWQDYVADRGFPAPFRAPPASNYAWDRDQVLAWKAHQAAGRPARPVANAVAALPSPPRAFATTPATKPGGANPTLQRQRHEMAAMMKRGA